MPLDTNTTVRPRVLVIAEAANPEWVSVPLVGWSLAQALREVADVHLVTQIRNREAILRAGLTEGTEFTAIDSEAITRPVWKLASLLRMGEGKGWTMMTAAAALSYPYFEHLVWKQFGPDLRRGAYDVVHRVTPLTPTTVSPLAAKCKAAGVPFVMGPLNGGVPWPSGFDAERRREREWLSYIRGIYKLLPGRGRMLRAASAIMVGSRHTQSEIPAPHDTKTVYIPENAIDPTRFNQRAAQKLDGPLRGCFVGRLVPYKGPDMAIEGTAPYLAAGQMTLDIIGDGPMGDELKAKVAKEGLTDAVTFHGQLPHEQVQATLSASNLLVFPSIREFGGGVVLEAMSLGVVPLVVDYAGPGELVDDVVGYKVPIGTREEIIQALHHSLGAIIEDPTALPGKAEQALARVEDKFTWQAKAKQICDVYAWVQGKRPSRPELF